MGYEFRLHIEPPLGDLAGSCDHVCAATGFRRIASSLSEPGAVGIQVGDEPGDPDWPQVADLHAESGGVIYFLSHGTAGGDFLRALVAWLRGKDFEVILDDDV